MRPYGSLASQETGATSIGSMSTATHVDCNRYQSISPVHSNCAAGSSILCPRDTKGDWEKKVSCVCPVPGCSTPPLRQGPGRSCWCQLTAVRSTINSQPDVAKVLQWPHPGAHAAPRQRRTGDTEYARDRDGTCGCTWKWFRGER